MVPNILNQNSTVFGKNQAWVSDITYIETEQGWVHPTVVIDLFHRRVVEWSIGETLSTEDTVIPAWNMAVRSNGTTEQLMFQSDGGSRYAGHGFTDILKNRNGPIERSMGGKGNCWDNAVAGSFLESLKVGWVHKHSYGLRS